MERFYGHICLDYSGGLYPVLSRNISWGGDTPISQRITTRTSMLLMN